MTVVNVINRVGMLITEMGNEWMALTLLGMSFSTTPSHCTHQPPMRRTPMWTTSLPHTPSHCTHLPPMRRTPMWTTSLPLIPLPLYPPTSHA